MNLSLWVLQILAAILYGASGIMKVFLFEKVSQDVPSFGALPQVPRGFAHDPERCAGLLMAFIAYGRMVLRPF